MADVTGQARRPSYHADTGVGFDSEGYILAPGADGAEYVQKATGTDTFLGVNHHDSYDVGANAPLLTGDDIGGVAVSQEGVVNVLCVDGVAYTPGDTIYMSATAGVGDASTTTNTEVGSVVFAKDTSDGDGTGTDLIPVRITGRV